MRTALRARLPFLVDSGYATLTAGSAGLLLVLLTIAGRFLSVPDYGRFRYALALTTIVETIMDLGLSQVTVRTVARDQAAGEGVTWEIGHQIETMRTIEAAARRSAAAGPE